MTTSIAGPWCTQILGALGADVIKVEAPGRGDEARRWGPPFWNGVSTAYLAANANKRSLAVDLKSEEGREAVLRVAETEPESGAGSVVMCFPLGARSCA